MQWSPSASGSVVNPIRSRLTTNHRHLISYYFLYEVLPQSLRSRALVCETQFLPRECIRPPRPSVRHLALASPESCESETIYTVAEVGPPPQKNTLS